MSNLEAVKEMVRASTRIVDISDRTTSTEVAVIAHPSGLVGVKIGNKDWRWGTSSDHRTWLVREFKIPTMLTAMLSAPLTKAQSVADNLAREAKRAKDDDGGES